MESIGCLSLLKRAPTMARSESVLGLRRLQRPCDNFLSLRKSVSRSQSSLGDQYCHIKPSCHTETPPMWQPVSAPACVRIIALSLGSLGPPTSKAQNPESRPRNSTEQPAMGNPDFGEMGKVHRMREGMGLCSPVGFAW